MSSIEKMQFDHAQIFYILDLGLMKILLILPKFHEKTVSYPGDTKVFRPGRMYMYTLPHLLMQC